jgi:hypothetical protein
MELQKDTHFTDKLQASCLNGWREEYDSSHRLRYFSMPNHFEYELEPAHGGENSILTKSYRKNVTRTSFPRSKKHPRLPICHLIRSDRHHGVFHRQQTSHRWTQRSP